MILLSLGASTVDARRGFGRIATHEAEGEGGRLPSGRKRKEKRELGT